MKKLLLIALCSLSALCVNAQKIYRVAGIPGGPAYLGDGGLALAARVNNPAAVAFDVTGNMYIADDFNNVVRMINTSGIISTVAGKGTQNYSGDGGAASLAELNNPNAVALDKAGNLYISDGGNNVIRKVNTSGIISTFAGNGAAGLTFNGTPTGVACDTSGNVYASDGGGNKIYFINSAGTFSSVYVGSATFGNIGDGGPATSAEINNPGALAFDASNNLYFCDQGNNRIRVVSYSTGVITHFAGNSSGSAGFSGDGAAATSAKLNRPTGIALDSLGNVFISDQNNNRIRKVTVSSGNISTYAGSGSNGYNGEAILATTAQFNTLCGLAVYHGNLFLADANNFLVRVVTNSCIKPTILSQPVISPNPNPMMKNYICLGTGAIINLSACNYSGYQWQVNKGSGFVNITTPQQPNFDTIGMVNNLSMNGWVYRYIAKGCKNDTSNSVILTISHPTITVTAPSICYGSSTSATLTASGATTYTWSTTDTGAVIVQTPTVTTSFTVTGTDTTTGCNGNAIGTITVLQAPVPNICMVTSDSTSTNNIIYWDKTIYHNVDSFIVYREVSTGNYKRIGAVSKDSLSRFIDTCRSIGPANGDPNIGFYHYKLQTLDTCRNYSALGPYHTSVYFIDNHTGTFTWNTYDVEGQPTPVANFILRRDNANTGVYVVVGNVSGNTTTLNDPNYSTYQSVANWRIDATGFNCTPTARYGNNSTQAAIIKAKSNITNNRTTGIKNNSESAFAVYPNPTNGNLTIGFSNVNTGKVNIKVVSVIGEEVYNETLTQTGENHTIDFSKYESGVYLVQITSNNATVVKRIVKN